jgi:histidyl-tRNA synthetase
VLGKAGVSPEAAEKLTEFSAIRGTPNGFLQELEKISLDKTTQTALEPLRQLATQLDDLGITEVCEFNAGIARGLDYYTGIVFEAWDRSSGLPRAIAGGGRYDDLVGIFEGQRLPGTGFGFGETVILELAEEMNLLPPPTPPADIYLAAVSKKQFSICREIASQLRSERIRTIFNGFSWSLTKQLDDAGKRQIPLSVIVGPRELAEKSVNVRDMKTGEEKQVKITKLAAFIKKALQRK